MKSAIVFAAIFAVAMAAVKYNPPSEEVPIISKSFDLNEDGSYGWEYEAGNGISAAESGVGGRYAKGNAQWTSPEGEQVYLQYTADENGYQPTGSHVPQVPVLILRALEYIRNHPYVEAERGPVSRRH